MSGNDMTKTKPPDHLIVAGKKTVHEVLRMNTAEFEAFIAEYGDELNAEAIQNLDTMRRKWAAMPAESKAKEDAALAPGALDHTGIYAKRLQAQRGGT